MPNSREENNAAASSSSSAFDAACTHCRHRKIRCGRERPKCSNCARDDSECDYQIPGKRVNHMKLLCNNVEVIDDRLLGIESQLGYILGAMKRDPSSSGTSVWFESSTSAFPSSSTSSDSNESDYGESTDRYRGPLSLLDLCQDLKNQIRSSVECEALLLGEDQQGTCVESLTQRLCRMALGKQTVLHEQSNNAPQLPSKDHIMKAQAQFFRRIDHTTDIFVTENFLANLDRIYKTHPSYRPEDDTWIICFKAIVLLVLGSELIDASTNTILGYLAGSLLLPGGAPLVNSRLLTAAHLINIQALILLSILAQQHESQAWSDMLLAQACTLAKTMRLHRADAAPPDATHEERQERRKVFQCLYIRDKDWAISRGTVSWLTEADPAIAFETDDANDDEYAERASRLELAIIQNRVYRLAHVSKPRNRNSKKLQMSLARIEEKLAKFALSRSLFNIPTQGSSEHVALQLAFLSTRIAAFLDSPSNIHARQAVLDSRASCIVLLLAVSPADTDLLRRFEKLVSSNRTAYQFSVSQELTMSAEDSSSKQKEPERLGSLASLAILHSFPPAAIFVLVKNILSPPQQGRDSELEDDLELIRRVYACYVSNASIMAAGSYGRILLSTYQVILQLLQLVKNGPQTEPVPATISPGSQFDTRSSTILDLSGSSSSMYPAQPNIDVDISAAFPAWPTLINTQGASWDGWQEAMSGGKTPSSLFDGFGIVEPQQDLSWSSQFQDDNNTRREKRRRTDDGQELQLDHNMHTAQRSIEDFLMSPEALQSLFPQGNT